VSFVRFRAPSKTFNLSQFNIEMIGVPMKRDYLAYLTGFEKSNMGEKINEYTVKRVLDLSGRI
jgi:hypothetical protein